MGVISVDAVSAVAISVDVVSVEVISVVVIIPTGVILAGIITRVGVIPGIAIPTRTSGIAAIPSTTITTITITTAPIRRSYRNHKTGIATR